MQESALCKKSIIIKSWPTNHP